MINSMYSCFIRCVCMNDICFMVKIWMITGIGRGLIIKKRCQKILSTKSSYTLLLICSWSLTNNFHSDSYLPPGPGGRAGGNCMCAHLPRFSATDLPGRYSVWLALCTIYSFKCYRQMFKIICLTWRTMTADISVYARYDHSLLSHMQFKRAGISGFAT